MKKILVLVFMLALFVFCMVSCSCNQQPNGQGQNQAPNTEAPQMAKIKFETYIDTKINDQQVPVGGRAINPGVTLSRPGYVFSGWYNGDKLWDFSTSVVTGDITLTAKWNSYLSYVSVSEIENEHIKALLGKENQDALLVAGCTFNVKDVVIPQTYNGKRVVGIYWAFAGRDGIESVTIPETVLYISQNAFNRCEALTKIVIPSSVSIIEGGAFVLCKGLDTIYCRAKEKPVKWDNDFNLKSTSSTERYNVSWGYTGN